MKAKNLTEPRRNPLPLGKGSSQITPVLYMKAIVLSGAQSPSVFNTTRKEDAVEFSSATHSALVERNQNSGGGL